MRRCSAVTLTFDAPVLDLEAFTLSLVTPLDCTNFTRSFRWRERVLGALVAPIFVHTELESRRNVPLHLHVISR